MEGSEKTPNKSIEKNKKHLLQLFNLQEEKELTYAKKRNLVFALTQLDKIASKLSLQTDIMRQAAIIYGRALEKDFIRGRSIETVVVVAIYTACRMSNDPRTLYEVSDAARMNYMEIGRFYRLLKAVLNLKIEPIKPKYLVNRFCSKLNLSKKVSDRAIKILEEPHLGENLAGRDPNATASAAIYLAAIMENEAIRQWDFYEVAKISAPAIRSNLKQLGTSIKVEWLVG